MKAVIYLAATLIVVYFCLPLIAVWQINRAINSLENYEGHVVDIRMAPFRGVYYIDGLMIKKRNSKAEAFVNIEQIKVNLDWKALLQKKIHAFVEIERPVIQLADSQKKNDMQFGLDEKLEKWNQVKNTLIPISIDRVTIQNGSVYFVNRDVKPFVPIKMEKIGLVIRDLITPTRNFNSPVSFSALVQGHAKVGFAGRVNADVLPPEVDIDFELRKFKMNTINRQLMAYIPINITRGELSVIGELAFANNDAVGYTKIFMNDPDIIATNQRFVSGRHVIIEVLTGLGSWFLKNKDTDKVATIIPFRYRNQKLNVDLSEAFWSSLENKTEEIKPVIDRNVSFRNLGIGVSSH